MLKKIVVFSFLFMSILNAATVETDKDLYGSDEKIVVNFSELTAQNHDWIGIYPAGVSNDWGNQVRWDWTGDKESGKATFKALAEGAYEVRIFYNNSFKVEAKKAFTVDANAAVATVTTSKKSYLPEEKISATFTNMSGDPEDWIALYPAGSSTDWGNQLDWDWVSAEVSGTRSFAALPEGEYEVRVFFHNSFKIEAVASFKVESPEVATVNLTLNKDEYAQHELIYIDYADMQGNATDWIGIYPVGASNQIKNVIDSKKTDGAIHGQISLGGLDTLPDTLENTGGLTPGEYEVRAFYNDSLEAEVVKKFSVVEKEVTSTVYESASGSISPNWVHISGPKKPYYYKGMVNLKPNWIDNYTNTSEFRLDFPQINTTQKVLELDAGGIRWYPHFFIGVILETTDGRRKMIWDPFFSHGRTKAFKSGNYLSYPLYVDIQRESATKHHVRLDVEKYLRILEPDNKVINISAFMASGGDLDEIKLSSH